MLIDQKLTAKTIDGQEVELDHHDKALFYEVLLIHSGERELVAQTNSYEEAVLIKDKIIHQKPHYKTNIKVEPFVVELGLVSFWQREIDWDG